MIVEIITTLVRLVLRRVFIVLVGLIITAIGLWYEDDSISHARLIEIEKVVGGLAINGAEMQFVTEYSNFAFRDGVLVHQQENKFAGGVNTAKLKLRSITLDADLGEADFIPDHEKFARPKQERRDVI